MGGGSVIQEKRDFDPSFLPLQSLQQQHSMRPFALPLLLAMLVFTAHIYAALTPANSLMNWFPSDDAFYYFQTARHIAAGDGITFDGLGRDSGFHPLWMAILTPLFISADLDPILPLRGVILLSALISAGTSVMVFYLARRAMREPVAFFLSLFWAFFPYIHNTVVEMGMEAGISALLLTVLLYRTAANKNNLPLTGLIGGLAVLARLDNIFVVGILGVWLVMRPGRARVLLVTDMALIVLSVFASYFLRVGFGPAAAQSAPSAYWMCAAAMALRIGIQFWLGGYAKPPAAHPAWWGWLARIAAGALLASVLLTAVMISLLAAHVIPAFPRKVLIYDGAFSLLAVLLTRLAAHWLDKDAPGWQWSDLQGTFHRTILFFTPLIALLCAYMAFSQWYFGTPMPVSGQVKRWWGMLPNVIYGQPVRDIAGMLGFFAKDSPWGLISQLTAYPIGAGVLLRLGFYGGLVVLVVSLKHHRAPQSGRLALQRLALYPFFLGSLVQIISYTGTGYLHMRSWYWVSDLLMITLLLGLFIDAAWGLAETGLRWQTGRPAWAIFGALSMLMVIYSMVMMVSQMPWYVRTARQTFYLDSIRELEANTDPGARIGSAGGGSVAYFVKNRTIINLDGLMNTTAYFYALQTGQAAAYLSDLGMRYVYTSEYPITSSDPYFQFNGHLKAISRFGGATLFRWQP